MSKILTHLTPREWQLVESRQNRMNRELPNRLRVPAPASDAWWYKLRSPRCDGTSSEQHRRNLHMIQETQHAIKERERQDKFEEAERLRKERELREKSGHRVEATKLNRLCESPKRRPKIAVQANLETGRPQSAGATHRPHREHSHTGERQHEEYHQRLNHVDGEQSATRGVRPVSAGRPASGIPPSPSKMPRYLVVNKAEARKKQLSDERKAAEKEVLAHAPKGMRPLNPDVKSNVVEILETRAAEIEESLKRFPFATSIDLDRKKGRLQRELAEINVTLAKYRFPIVHTRYHDPVPLR